MDQAVVNDSREVVVSHDRAVALIDELRRQERLLGVVQARRAALMVEFGDVRRGLDQRVIGDRAADGRQARYRAGEFAVTEISLAVTASKHGIGRVLGMTRRLQADAPDVWDSWCAGEIDHDKALRINRALRRLVRDDSKQLLNNLVVKIAPHKTPELLGRWLNQFIAEVEPDQTDERLRRAFEDRYVSVRPDIHGISFLHAALSCVDAAAIDQLLSALAGVTNPGDDRTFAQRRADAMVDVLCGRTSNGCGSHETRSGFDTNSDTDDHLDDANSYAPEQTNPGLSGGGRNDHGEGNGGGGVDGGVRPDDGINPDTSGANSGRSIGESDWEAGDFGRPATAFRPDGPSGSAMVSRDKQRNAWPPDTDIGETDEAGRLRPGAGIAGGRDAGTTRGACVCAGNRPLPVTIGIVVTASALFGYNNAPGQLADRSSLIPADIVRDLAAQPGTLFHRLITDDSGNLLQVNELGRFPSRKLGLAVRYRDPVCATPTCHTPATRCDLDHLTPVPEGSTTGVNLGAECRGEHRAKTHGGHRIARTGPHSIEWTTPTGHRYSADDPPLPIDICLTATGPGPAMSDAPPAPQPDLAEPLPKHRKPKRKRKRRRA
jgi:hypothetical protein